MNNKKKVVKMEKYEIESTCPKCLNDGILDSLSRIDNETEICNDCGTAEALYDFENSIKK